MDQVFDTPEDGQGFQDEESREPSVLEYARFYGLTTNYLNKKPFEEAIEAASELYHVLVEGACQPSQARHRARVDYE